MSRRPFPVKGWIICGNLTAKAPKNLSRDAPNFSATNDPHVFAIEIELHQSGERKIMITHPVVCPVDLAVQRQKKSKSVLGHGVRRISRNTGNDHPQFPGGLEIDIVKSRATQREHGDPPFLQSDKGLAIRDIIHKEADCATIAGQRGRPG